MVHPINKTPATVLVDALSAFELPPEAVAALMRLPVPMLLCDTHGALLETNAAFLQLTGTTHDAVRGRRLEELGIDASISVTQVDGGTARRRARFQGPGGRDVSVTIAQVAVRHQGRDCLLSVWLDSAREAHLEDELRRSEETYRVMVEQVEDYAIFMLDVEGRVRTWNAGAQHLKGYSALEILGRPFEVFYTDDDRRKGLPVRLLDQARREGHAVYDGWRLRKDGSLFWAEVALTALHDATGAVIGFVKVTRDVTDRREREAAERRVFEKGLEVAKLREVAAMKTAFMNVSAHELLTPLSPIMTV